MPPKRWGTSCAPGHDRTAARINSPAPMGSLSAPRRWPHQLGTEEFVLCIAGTLEVGPIDQEQFLRPGDSLWFPADRDHRYASRRGARGLSVISYPTLREA